jgi:serine/threonine-protein kinase
MTLAVGTTLGSYQVTAKIGEGGMGEVYRARDTKLDRDVALKVLPQAFTDDPDRLARFEREAKVLASLNHTNIGHIYGLEEAEGQKALVLELVEGPTLADRIAQGPIPIDEALPIAKQIAEALEAAHEAGVIHRDLKPANIKVRDDGTVKVLDFGLAKAFQPEASEASQSMSPTISLTAAATQMGMVIGTAAYMAPEQAKGKPVDKRADVWAFGAVLYEMLTGRKPFSGDDVSTTLARVIEREPDWDTLPSNLSPVLATYLRRCLAKEPKQRIPDIADMRLAMDGAFETTARALPREPTVPHPAKWKQASPWVAGILLAVVTGVAVWSLLRPGPPRVTRFAVSFALSIPAVNRGLSPPLRSCQKHRLLTPILGLRGRGSPSARASRQMPEESVLPSSRDALPHLRLRELELLPEPQRVSTKP